MERLEELRVVKLRAELEKRNLDKSGVKAVLVERLRKVIEEESSPSNSSKNIVTKQSESNMANIYSQQNGSPSQERRLSDELTNNEDYVASYGKENLDEMVKDAYAEGDEFQIQDETDESYNHNYTEESAMLATAVDESINLQNDTQQELSNRDDIQNNEHDGCNTTEGQQREATEDFEANAEDNYINQKDSSEKKKEDESRTTIEDAINFMVDEDDNMLDEEMIYEDGTTIKTGQDESSIPNGKDYCIRVVMGQQLKQRLEDVLQLNSLDYCATSADSAADHHGVSLTSTTNTSDGDGSRDRSCNKDNSAAATATTSTDAEAANKGSNDNLESSNMKSTSGSSVGKDRHSADVKGANSGRNLWVSGLSSSTSAQDLKQHFRKHGKVTSAKIVTSTKTPGSKCFGFVTMGSSDEAAQCIKFLNKTELHGRIIQVEQATSESGVGSGKSGSQGRSDNSSHSRRDGNSEDGRRSAPHRGRSGSASRRGGVDKDGDKRRQDNRGISRDRERRPRLVDHRYGAPRPIRALSNRGAPTNDITRRRSPLTRRLSPRRAADGRRASPGRRLPSPRRPDKEMLGLSQIMEERERERMRARERLMREEERRAREEEARQRMMERRQREEAERLQREREQLRIERERIERQKQELLRLEREQQRLEREKLEREREDLRRQQLKLVHSDRLTSKSSSRYDDIRGGRSTLKRPADDRGRSALYDDRKRTALESRVPRYDEVPRSDARPPISRYESPRDSHRYDSAANAVIPPTHVPSYDRDRDRDRTAPLPPAAVAGSRYDRHHHAIAAVPASNSLSSVGKSSGDNARWMQGSSAVSTTARRSDSYYDDRRSDSSSTRPVSNSVGTDSRMVRDYHGQPLLSAPPPHVISRGTDSARSSRDSGSKGYGGSGSSSSNINSGGDVWRTSSSSKAAYGSSSSSSKNLYGSSSTSSSKTAYNSSNGGSGALLPPQDHDGSTWRGGASTSSSVGRWTEGRSSGSSSALAGGGSSSSVGGSNARISDFPRSSLTSGMSSSSTSSSHHPTLQGMMAGAPDSRGGYDMQSSSSYTRKY